MSDVLAATLDRPRPSQSASGERPIDLVHLARMTLGERSLEREVLQLFDRQAMLLIARMQTVPAAAVATLAHTLKGSARAIGAGCVARAAETVELTGTVDEAELARALAALGAAIDEARAYIAELLRAH
jgi:HPt (histidine-containing phosphotransfer) domain-containing protein